MILLLSLLILKHFIVDFPMQIPYMYLNKGTYGHNGGVLHATLHALATFGILFYATGDLRLSNDLACVDGFVHYHIDWAKMNIGKKTGWGPLTSEYFWWLLGLDQYLHYMTYVFILWDVNKLGGIS